MTSSTPPPRSPSPPGLSHVQVEGRQARARMVDVGAKPVTARTARAHALVRFPAGVLERALAGSGPKGPVEEVARVAGILAAKRTADWIPLCHPLALDQVDVRFERRGEDLLEVLCCASCSARTGVEMEALVGASAAALTVYDMCKGLAKGIVVERVELLEKTGGASGDWHREG